MFQKYAKALGFGGPKTAMVQDIWACRDAHSPALRVPQGRSARWRPWDFWLGPQRSLSPPHTPPEIATPSPGLFRFYKSQEPGDHTRGLSSWPAAPHFKWGPGGDLTGEEPLKTSIAVNCAAFRRCGGWDGAGGGVGGGGGGVRLGAGFSGGAGRTGAGHTPAGRDSGAPSPRGRQKGACHPKPAAGLPLP